MKLTKPLLPEVINQAIKYRSSRLPEIAGHTFYSSAISADSVVVDLGAHHGGFSHAIIDLYGCTCHAVEALPDNCKNMPDLANLHIYNFAITAENGPVTINIAERSTPWGSVQHLGQTEYKESIETTGIKFEHFLEQNNIRSIDLLKVDIEGEEFSLFETTSNETLKSIAQITVEFHDFLDPSKTTDVKNIIYRLESLNFIAIVMTQSFHGDVLFINRDKIPINIFEVSYIRSTIKFGRGIRRIFARLTQL